jgi:hypothetical protein
VHHTRSGPGWKLLLRFGAFVRAGKANAVVAVAEGPSPFWTGHYEPLPRPIFLDRC